MTHEDTTDDEELYERLMTFGQPAGSFVDVQDRLNIVCAVANSVARGLEGDEETVLFAVALFECVAYPLSDIVQDLARLTHEAKAAAKTQE